MKFKNTSLSFPDSLLLQPQDGLSLLPYLQKINVQYIMKPKKSKSADLPILPSLYKKQTELNSELLNIVSPQKFPDKPEIIQKTLSKKYLKSILDSKSKKETSKQTTQPQKTPYSDENSSEKLDLPIECRQKRDRYHTLEEKKNKRVVIQNLDDNFLLDNEARDDPLKIEPQKFTYDYVFEEEKEDFREAKLKFYSYRQKGRSKVQSTDSQENKLNEKKEELNRFLLPMLTQNKKRSKKEEIKYSFEKLMVHNIKNYI